MPGQRDNPAAQSSRPIREPLGEIAALSLFCVVIAAVITALCGLDAREAWDLASAAGSAVLDHVGWAFGVFVPVLLAFYAIVIGGQLAGAADASRTQRILGVVAEGMVSSLVLALLLIAVACIAEPSLAGSLFVIVPVLGVTLFLAVQLGGFAVFEREHVLKEAENTRALMDTLSRGLRVRSRKPVWAVTIVNVIAAAGFGTAAAWTVAKTDSSSTFDPSFAASMYVILVAVHVIACLFAVGTAQSGSDRLTRFLGWFVGISMSAFLFFSVIPTAVTHGLAIGAGLLAALFVSTTSALWRRGNTRRATVDWSIQGAGSRYAARSIAKTRARAVREIQRTRTAPEVPSLPDRFRAAVNGFRNGVAP